MATYYNIVAWAIAAVIVAVALPVQRVDDSNSRQREEDAEKLDETSGDDLEHLQDDDGIGMSET
jgi:hypothetical protein